MLSFRTVQLAFASEQDVTRGARGCQQHKKYTADRKKRSVGEEGKEVDEHEEFSNPLLSYLQFVTYGLHYSVLTSEQEKPLDTGEDPLDRFQLAVREFLAWVLGGRIIPFKFEQGDKEKAIISSQQLQMKGLDLMGEVILLHQWENIMKQVQRIEEMLEGIFGKLPRDFPLLALMDHIVQGKFVSGDKERIGKTLRAEIEKLRATLSLGEGTLLNTFFVTLFDMMMLIQRSLI